MALLRRFAEPVHRFGVIRAKTRFTLPPRQTDPLLCIGIAVFGRAPKPLERFRHVGFYTPSGLQKHTEIVFGQRVTMVRRATQPLRTFR
jgi:hypothetical protein